MAKERSIFTITLTNFSKYNGTIKKGHKSTLISNRFCTDAKIRALTIHTRWLFLNLVLTCGDLSRDTVELSSDQLRTMLECNRNIDRELDQLQSLQLLTWQKNDLFINRIEKKRIEKKRIEIPGGLKTPAVEDPRKSLNRKVWESYESAYLARYKTEPVRNASVNAKISQIAARLGDEAIPVISFYLTHNDSFYVKSMHSIGLALSHAEALRTQWVKGKAVTEKDVKRFAESNDFQNLINDIQENGI